ncbi:MAG: tRNA (N6-isopentenyl adenosine(37)-C2)-methylthiotransferase MiaB [Candidatus Cloacimonetes bacterium]|nr:tRNA (N6-isopentenyl adenosine(37)-C2)-methylthiotransferase MiaB [Candidatus Cloacimonadota bacterium]
MNNIDNTFPQPPKERFFYLETYGCQMNVADSELIIGLLSQSGYRKTDDIDQADVIIFNTCSVRKHAEDRVLGRISNEKQRKLNKPDLKIGIVGCMAQRIGKRLIEDNSGIDFALGVDNYSQLPSFLAALDEPASFTDMNESEIYENIEPEHQGSTCGFVTIMRGCDNFCSYCIVPHVRGRERSRPFEHISHDVESAGNRGLKDITLLGQNVNSYHFQEIDFPILIERLAKINSIERLRFITSHPKDLSDELIRVMADSPKICKHIHLPLQSGSTAILRKMNRKYDIDHYLTLIHKLKAAMPEIAVTTDLIAGFPSETEADFEETLSVMRDVQFDYAFCFKYSERESTAAAEYTLQVPQAERLSRLQRMIDLQREITLKKFQAQIGKEVVVYIENLSRKSSQQVSGKTDDFKIAVLDGSEKDFGKLVKARVISATSGTLICQRQA